MADIIELHPKPQEGVVEGPEVSDEASTWTVEDAIAECLNDIKAKKIAMPSHLYIAMLIPGDDGEHKMAYVQAGMKNCFETIGVLEIHKSYHSGHWRES